MAGFTIDRGGGGVGVIEGGGTGAPSTSTKKNALSGLYAKLNTINGTPNPGKMTLLTGMPSGETRNPRGETVQMKEKVVFKSELHETLSLGLENELQRLVELSNSGEFGNNRDQQDIATIWASPRFRPYRQLFDEFVKPEKDGSRMKKLDTEALQQYLSTDKGYIKTIAMTQVKMENMATMAAAFALANLPTEGVGVIDQRQENYVTDARGGAGTEAVRGVVDWLRTPFQTHGRETPLPIIGAQTRGGAVGWAALGGVLGGVLGSAVGPGGTVGGAALGVSGAAAIESAIYAISQGFKRSDRTFLRQTEEALRYAQSPDMAADRIFSDRMYSLSPKNWTIDGNGNVIVRPDIANNTHVATATLSPRETRDILFGLDKLIKQAQKEVYGVQQQFRSSMRIPGRGQDPQRGILIEDEANEQFKRNLQYDTGVPIPGTGGATMEVPCSAYIPERDEWVDNLGQLYVYVDTGAVPPTYNYYEYPNPIDPANPLNTLPTTPVDAFNTITRDFAYERRIYREAFIDVLSQGFETDFAMIAAGKVDELSLLAEIVTAREGMREAIIAARTADIDEDDRLMGIDRERLNGENGELRAFVDLNGDPARVNADDRDRATLLEVDQQRRAEQVASSDVTISYHPTGATDVLTVLNDVLRNATPPLVGPIPVGWAGVELQINVGDETHIIRSIAGRKEAVETDYTTRITTIEGRVAPSGVGVTKDAINAFYATVDKDKKLAEERRKDQLARIKEDEAVVARVRKSILDARSNIEAAREALSHKSEQRATVQRTTAAMITARQNIEGWGTPLIPPYPGNPVGFPENVLDTDALATLPYDELERRINLANTINNNFGWPEAENARRRLDILHGKAEAIARQDPLSPISTPSAEFPGVILRPTTVTPGWGIDESALLTYSTPQLTELFANRFADLAGLIPPIVPPPFPAGGATPNQAEIGALQREAQLRFRARQRALQQVVGEIDARIAENGRERERITVEVTRSPELKVIGEAVARKGKIIQTITEMPIQILAEELRPDLGNTQPEIYSVAGANPEEQNREIGYNFILGLLSDYMNAPKEVEHEIAGRRTVGRVASYQRISEIITQNDLGDLMFLSNNLNIQRLFPPVPPNPPPTLDACLAAVQNAMIAGQISRVQFSDFLIRDIIGNNRDGFLGPRAKAV